eukprot:gene9366-biopygen10185
MGRTDPLGAAAPSLGSRAAASRGAPGGKVRAPLREGVGVRLLGPLRRDDARRVAPVRRGPAAHAAIPRRAAVAPQAAPVPVRRVVDALAPPGRLVARAVEALAVAAAPGAVPVVLAPVAPVADPVFVALALRRVPGAAAMAAAPVAAVALPAVDVEPAVVAPAHPFVALAVPAVGRAGDVARVARHRGQTLAGDGGGDGETADVRAELAHQEAEQGDAVHARRGGAQVDLLDDVRAVWRGAQSPRGGAAARAARGTHCAFSASARARGRICGTAVGIALRNHFAPLHPASPQCTHSSPLHSTPLRSASLRFTSLQFTRSAHRELSLRRPRQQKGDL